MFWSTVFHPNRRPWQHLVDLFETHCTSHLPTDITSGLVRLSTTYEELFDDLLVSVSPWRPRGQSDSELVLCWTACGEAEAPTDEIDKETVQKQPLFWVTAPTLRASPTPGS